MPTYCEPWPLKRKATSGAPAPRTGCDTAPPACVPAAHGRERVARLRDASGGHRQAVPEVGAAGAGREAHVGEAAVSSVAAEALGHTAGERAQALRRPRRERQDV